MAIAGRDGDARRGAHALGQFALAIAQATESRALQEQRLALRIGIHCGPVTAGVIGDTRFAFDVWGDAVNTASRMESHGQPGRIHVSEAFHALATDLFQFEERGHTKIKSLGTTHTYFLIGLSGEATGASEHRGGTIASRERIFNAATGAGTSKRRQ